MFAIRRDSSSPTSNRSDFELYEDGVKQELVSFVLSHGGRTYNQKAPPSVAVQEGVLRAGRAGRRATPPVACSCCSSTTYHLDFGVTPKTRELLKKMLKSLIHDGDMFGIVTTGTSSVSQQLTYDEQILESAITRITGNALKPSGDPEPRVMGSAGTDRGAASRARGVRNAHTN